MKTIYAYYESLLSKDQNIEFAKANLWKDSWSRAGWNPVMLNSSHAQISPQRIKLAEKMMSIFPLLNRQNNESQDVLQLRWNRLCALHAAGGGWISDYDVLNLGFTPSMGEEWEKSPFVIAGKPANVMYISKEICNAAMNKILSSEMISTDGVIFYEKDIFVPFLDFVDHSSLRHAQDYEKMKKVYEDYLTSQNIIVEVT